MATPPLVRSQSAPGQAQSERDSVVWQFFEKVVNGEGDKKETRIVCKICRKDWKWAGATTHQKEHLLKRHRAEAQNHLEVVAARHPPLAVPSPRPQQNTLEGFLSNSAMRLWQPDNREAILC